MKEEKEKKRKGEEMKCNWHWCLRCAGDEAQQFNPPTSSTLHHPLPFLLWYESILGAIYHLHLLTVHFLSIWHSRGLYYNSKGEANCFSCKSCNIFRLLRLNLMNTVHFIVFSIASSRCIQIPHEQFWPWEPCVAGEIQVSQPTYVQHTCISITVSIVWKNFKSCQPQLEFLYVRKISGLVSNLTIALIIQISVHLFCSKYDLYSKSKVRIDVEKVKPYYLSLINKVCSASVPSSLEYGKQNMYVQNIFKLVKTAEMLSTVILGFAVMESKCLP